MVPRRALETVSKLVSITTVTPLLVPKETIDADELVMLRRTNAVEGKEPHSTHNECGPLTGQSS